MKPVFITAVLILFATGCKKQQESQRFYANKTFSIDNSIGTKAVRMFTKNGEITDSTLTHDFVRRNTTGIGFSNPFHLNAGSYPADITFKISFYSADSAIMIRSSAPMSPDTVFVSLNKKATVSVITDGLLLMDKDSTSWHYIINDYNIDLIFRCIAYFPERNCELLWPGMAQCAYLPRIPLKIEKEQLFLPLTSVLVKTQYGTTSIWGFMNSFKAPDLNQLLSRDTIAVQTNEARLKME